MQGNSGFTLIELILVTVIIGILAAMVVPVYSGRVYESQVRAAKGDISNYSSQVELYALDNNDQFPKTLQELVSGRRKYVRELRDDPWGNPYIYEPPTNVMRADYKLFSAGPDGTPGNADDVTSTSEIE